MMKRWLWRNWPRRWDFKTRYFQSSNSAYYFCFLLIFNPVQFKDFNSVAEEDYNNYLAGHVVNSFTHATHQDGREQGIHISIFNFSNFVRKCYIYIAYQVVAFVFLVSLSSPAQAASAWPEDPCFTLVTTRPAWGAGCEHLNHPTMQYYAMLLKAKLKTGAFEHLHSSL